MVPGAKRKQKLSVELSGNKYEDVPSVMPLDEQWGGHS